jgi:hypothetical protein
MVACIAGRFQTEEKLFRYRIFTIFATPKKVLSLSAVALAKVETAESG